MNASIVAVMDNDSTPARSRQRSDVRRPGVAHDAEWHIVRVNVAERDMNAVLTDARVLAQRLYKEAALVYDRALDVAEEARAVHLRVTRHLRAAERHDLAANRHDGVQERWITRGEKERADFSRRSAAIERDSAQLERDRAAHEELCEPQSGS